MGGALGRLESHRGTLPGTVRFVQPRHWTLSVMRTLLLALLVAARPARAAERSELEKSVATEALAHFGWETEAEPAGKEIEAIEIYTLDVFDERDPVPQFVNALHVTSRDYVIRRQLLFEVGQPWSLQRTEETERNLRGTRQISLANVVVARGSTPDKVRLLVIVKDVWSLRLNSNIGFGGDGLEYLLLNPAEENLAGTQSSIGLLYLLDPFRQTFGARYIQPRLGGTRYYVAAQAAIITNRQSGVVEGSSGTFIFEWPQFSLRTPFSYGTRAAWLTETTRRAIGTELRTFDYQPTLGQVERVPWVYYSNRLAAEYFGLLSRGLLRKLDFTFGIEVDQRLYRSPDLETFSAETRAAFQSQVLPVSDTRLSPFAQVRIYEGRYHRVLDLELLGLQEDFRLGYDVLARGFVAAERLGSSRDLVGALVGVGYTWALGTGLLRVGAESRTVVANQNRNDASASLAGRIVSPLIGPGRIHVDADVAARFENYLNLAPYSLGGNGRLRGYRFNQFQGNNFVAANVEYRSRSVDLLSAQVGMAAFYDVGDTPDEFSALQLHQGLGVGLRILFPQADRAVVRLDYGVPLDTNAENRGGAFYVTFGQAFGLPGLSTPSVTSALSAF